MITDFRYADSWDKGDVIAHAQNHGFKRVIDIGGSAGGWSRPIMTHCVDVVPRPEHEKLGVKAFIGNVNTYAIWTAILEDVERNGKFDFSICTHTLEDLANPALVCEMLPRIAKAGFIAVPSKYAELRRHEGRYLGWIHHRWIFNKEGEKFVAYPKLTFLEYKDWNPILNASDLGVSSELRFFWTDRFDLEVVNGDYMGPNIRSVLSYFERLARD